MAAAAYQEFGEDRQGARDKVMKAASVAVANATLKSLRASAGHIAWLKIVKMAGAAY